MIVFEDDRPHPMGLIDNPEWQVSLTRRAELYLEDRARRENPEREPNRFHVALGIVAALFVVLSLCASVMP